MRAARLARKWSQGDLADELTRRGVGTMTHATISRIEGGKRRVGLAEARAIADAFSTTIDALSGPLDEFKDVLSWNDTIGMLNMARDQLLDASASYEFTRALVKVRLSAPPSSVSPNEVENLEDQIEDNAYDVAMSDEVMHRVEELRAQVWPDYANGE